MSETHDIAFARIESSAFDVADFAVKTVRGHEAISQLFRFDVVLVSKSESPLGVDDLEGAPITLVIGRGEHVARRVHGLVSRVSRRRDQTMAQAIFEITIVPRMWLLTLVTMTDVQKDSSVPDMTKDKLALVDLSPGVDFEMCLVSGYEAREFMLQHQETDYAFVTRHLEHMGISFVFEQGEEDRVVFIDKSEGFPELGGDGLTFREAGYRDGVFSIEHVRTPIAGTYVAYDFNYRTPHVDLYGQHRLEEGFGGGIIEYGGHFKTPRGAARFAEMRAQEQLCHRDVYVCESDVPEVTAGARIAIHGYDGALPGLLVTEVTHTMELTTHHDGSGTEQGYRNTFRAIDASRQYRPPRTTPVPRVPGIVTGIIETGPTRNERYAKLDDDGRYHVRLAFDTTAPGDRAPSHRMRMLQLSAGPGYGVHFPLKPGAEVFIAFSNGDPDRPVIVGAVPNPATATPVTAKDATMNRIRTESGVLIEIEDGSGPRPS